MIKFTNNWLTTLQSGIAADDTEIVIDSSHALSLGTIAAGDYYIATMTDDLDNPVKKEIIHITGITAETLTVTRAQESTNGQSFLTGNFILIEVTAGMLDSFVQGTTPDGDGDIVLTDSEQTLINKRLTNPKLNEDVALTKTATELNATLTDTAVYAYADSAVATSITALDATITPFLDITLSRLFS